DVFDRLLDLIGVCVSGLAAAAGLLGLLADVAVGAEQDGEGVAGPGEHGESLHGRGSGCVAPVSAGFAGVVSLPSHFSHPRTAVSAVSGTMPNRCRSRRMRTVLGSTVVCLGERYPCPVSRAAISSSDLPFWVSARICFSISAAPDRRASAPTVTGSWAVVVSP